MTNREACTFDEVTEEVCEACKGRQRGGPEACSDHCDAYQKELDKPTCCTGCDEYDSNTMCPTKNCPEYAALEQGPTAPEGPTQPDGTLREEAE